MLISKFNGAVYGDNHQKSGVVFFEQSKSVLIFHPLTGLVFVSNVGVIFKTALFHQTFPGDVEIFIRRIKAVNDFLLLN